MRFVWAVVAFVLATLLIGAGIAQRTIFMGPAAQQVELSVEDSTPFVLVDGAVLRANPGQQTLLVRGDGDLFAAYGRTADMQAWLSDATYTAIDLDTDGEPTSTVVEPAVQPEEGEPAEGETEQTGRNPAGSDLWLDSFSESDQLITDMQLPEGMSILIAKDGTEPAPSDIMVSWPVDRSTPLVGPLITAGGIVLLVGLVLYVLAIRHQRRGRGPRRKGPGPLPVTEPIDLSVEPAPVREALEEPKDADAASGSDSEAAADAKEKRTERRALKGRRLLVLPALGLAGLMFAGCSSDSWPQFDAATPTPTPTQTVITPENQKPPAVTQAQASRILQSISATIEQADADRDIDLAGTRLSGMALDARSTDYTLRGTLADREPPAAIPTEAIEVLLPQATDEWPRTVLVLSKSKSDDTIAPTILTMTQADPWSNYMVTNIAEMQASTEIPQLAPAWLGTSLITENAAAFLTLAPDELATAFADVVDSGEKSEYYGSFDPVALSLADSIVQSRNAVTQALADGGAAETSQAAFDVAPSDDPAVAMATLDSGAIVAVSLVDQEKITPKTSDAVIRFGENPEAKALTGAEEASNGVVTTYGLQLFFSVPSQGSTEQVRLLAVHQDILNVEVIK
ncbi:glycosyl transferase [Microbacterium tenebrionis]|nr:glycosyl transferase [Microbacterium tenebrionis]